MDTDLWMRFYIEGAKYIRVNNYLWMLRLHPKAKMSGHHFSDSPMADENHPVWESRRREREEISNR